MSAIAPAPTPSALPLALRLARRELRGALQSFVVFIACIALGVMSIAAVGSLSRSLTEGLAREGRTILGGDLAVSLIQREAEAPERQFLETQGIVSSAATLRAMARTGEGASALVELKAVDDRYPLYGAVAVQPNAPLPEVLAERDGVYGVAAEPALLARLGLSPGARIMIGTARLEIRATLVTEPDKLASGIAFGPRLLLSQQALRATGLLVPGSLVRWTYRLRLANGADDAAVEAVGRAVKDHFPQAGWELRTRSNASPQLERNIERFMQFLTLVGLTALLVGGVGVANAVKGYVDRKQEVIATLKALGASGGAIVGFYLLQVMLLAAVGTLIGLAAGMALPFLVAGTFGSIIPLPIAPSVQPQELALAAGYGLLTAMAFALWPLGRAHDVPVSALFRDRIAPQPRWPRPRYVLVTLAALAALAGLAVFSAYDRRIAVIFIVAAAAVLATLRLIASLVMAAARRLPHARNPVLRLAIANIHRPGALTPTVMLSLGLGLALLVTVTLIDGNLRSQFLAGLPERAPAFYFLDIQEADAPRFDALLAQRVPGGKLDRVPMLRGRIIAVNGEAPDTARVAQDAAWALQGDRGITYAQNPPEGSRVVAGQWWASDYAGAPLVSLESRIAEGIGVKVGDKLTVNVLGRNITAEIANLRRLDWQSLGINFVLVFSPNAFRGAPHTSIATFTYPRPSTVDEELDLLKSVAAKFPAITVVRVKEALETIGTLVTNLVTGIRAASLLSILSAILVLGGALSASHRSRVYEAVILKTLGATRRRLLVSYAVEYLSLGVITAAFGVAAGSFAAWFVVADVMKLRFVWLPAPALTAAAGAVLLTVLLGLVGTVRALGQKAAPVLRAL